MRNLHLPVWLGAKTLPQAPVFAALFMLTALPRSILVAVVPLSAHAVLGDAQKVSVLYFAVSLAGVAASLSIPALVRRFRRRWVFSLGAALAVAAAVLLSVRSAPFLAAGLAAQVYGTACIEITLSLYIMDQVPRREFGTFEPMRVLFAVIGLAVGPWLGVYLETRMAAWLPFALSAAGAGVMFGYFWFLRLTEHPAVPTATRAAPHPLKFLHRFFVQPRLRLAWVLAVGRSSWWSLFYIYAPIYAVTAGLGEEVGGAIVSGGLLMLLIVPFWGWLGRRYGVRWVLIVGYAASGAATLAVAAAAGVPWLGAALLVCAACGTGVIDGAGNVPFLRAVRWFERPEMSTVYATYRDVAQLAPPGVFSVLLKLFDLPTVFVVGGLTMLGCAGLSRFVPRRL
ncbi:MAG: MFS transporter [Proteobacteria bacterium]|nr:MFS transporter [Pseudomonadota bacterium]